MSYLSTSVANNFINFCTELQLYKREGGRRGESGKVGAGGGGSVNCL